MKSKCTPVVFLTILILTTAIWAKSPADTCWADADVNNDGLVLSVADYVHLVRFCQGEDVGLPVPYKADLNGDCMIDYLDVLVYEDYFDRGLTAFAPWGDYPVPTCCDPNTIMGACCTIEECQRLNPANCPVVDGEYWGDGTLCDQMPGDANSDSMFNIGDPVYLINYFYKDGPPPNPAGNGDVNGDCRVNLDDLVFFMCFLPEKQLFPVACTCRDPVMGEPYPCLPGDANDDRDLNVADAVYLIGMIFRGGSMPMPFNLLSGDANGDAQINLGDVVFLISYIFKGGPPPMACIEWMWYWPCLHPDGYYIDRQSE